MAPVRALIGLLSAASALAGVPARAQPVTSPGPDSVAVTIYRDPDRSAADQPKPGWLRGYALITERRTITIPAGRAVIRFEGVAGGILPESAIVTGLPDGVREKNLDAALLSPGTLYARSLGRPVTIRRTREGKVTEERAVIRSGLDGAAVLETRDGIIAVDCEGSEELVYDSVPAGLSAKPTLSVETDSTRAHQVTVTLSYLAWGFDWQANYVATMRPDGKSADLFAWVTLANGDVTSFADAETMVVAGQVNREDRGGGRSDLFRGGGDPIQFKCFSRPPPPPPAPPAPPSPPSAGFLDQDAIVVTGFRANLQSSMAVKRNVVREALGDLQAYRVPHPTTVASQSQKQVALLDRESVPVEVIYKTQLYGDIPNRITITLRTRNREDKGLGVPLPAGNVAIFEPLGESRALIGEGSIDDKAVGEEVEIGVAPATQVTVEAVAAAKGKGWTDYVATVRNANPFAIRYESSVVVPGYNTNLRIARASPRLGRRNGEDVWSVEVPANGSAVLRYRVKEVRRSGR
ncbi:MAG: hypothetical protein V4574_21135 [Pseudomonadota bacterium]